MAGEVDDAGWDEFGERVVSVGTCAHCGEKLDEWEIFVETEIQVRRPVLLWKHRRDGAVVCGPAGVATPVTGKCVADPLMFGEARAV